MFLCYTGDFLGKNVLLGCFSANFAPNLPSIGALYVDPLLSMVISCFLLGYDGNLAIMGDFCANFPRVFLAQVILTKIFKCFDDARVILARIITCSGVARVILEWNFLLF